MLIYANCFDFEPGCGPRDIIELVARWAGTKAKAFVDEARLAGGIKELRLKDGSILSSRATSNIVEEVIYPFLFSAQLSHRDGNVAGRKWITEIGIRQVSQDAGLECTLLLKTDEVSARVTSPVQVTRPWLVEQLMSKCKPSSATPGLRVKRLDEDSAVGFLNEVERESRDFPIIVVSHGRSAGFPVEPERLCSIVAGLAEVVVVPEGVDTIAVEQVVGRRFMAFGGAINIVFPLRRRESGRSSETVLLRPEAIQELKHDGKSIESEVLGAITHRTNLPASWRHISPSDVDQARLHRRTMALVEQAKKGDASKNDLAEYVELLEAADQELAHKTSELSGVRSDLEEKETEARSLRSEVQSLKQVLSGIESDTDDEDFVEVLGPIREQIARSMKGNPSLQDVLNLVGTLYPDRLVLLETASASAKESDRSGFNLGLKAFELLQLLATNYWQALADGRGDQKAKAAFGQDAYASNEGNALSQDGKRLRTFSYRGKDYLMEKHLKHGVKDSKARTLRVHFEWFPAERKIVVGHCGKHLDF